LAAVGGAVAVAQRRVWTATGCGLLMAVGGAVAFCIAHGLGYNFWHQYGHDVYDTCSGDFIAIALWSAGGLTAVGMPLALLPAMVRLFR